MAQHHYLAAPLDQRRGPQGAGALKALLTLRGPSRPERLGYSERCTLALNVTCLPAELAAMAAAGRGKAAPVMLEQQQQHKEYCFLLSAVCDLLPSVPGEQRERAAVAAAVAACIRVTDKEQHQHAEMGVLIPIAGGGGACQPRQRHLLDSCVP
jgi:hypothetical protein